jgi:iron uptake system EfeUOB component EfeO/EfeM
MESALFGFEFELDSCQIGRWVDYHFQKVQTIIDDYPSDNDYDAYIRCTTDHLDEELESLDGD